MGRDFSDDAQPHSNTMDKGLKASSSPESCIINMKISERRSELGLHKEDLDICVLEKLLQTPPAMTREQFLEKLQVHAATFGKAVATNEGEWIIKGFIDVYRRIYTISVDTKIVSKVLELLLFPMFVEFAKANRLKIDLCPQLNFYPDLTFTHEHNHPVIS